MTYYHDKNTCSNILPSIKEEVDIYFIDKQKKYCSKYCTHNKTTSLYDVYVPLGRINKFPFRTFPIRA